MTRTTSSFSILLSVALVCGSATAADSPGLEERLEASGRSEADRARDAGRKPAQVVAFLGIEPGMKVMDVIAASGWYTEVLSLAVGPKGTVYAQNTAFALRYRDGMNDRAMTSRLAGDRLPNVRRVDAELSALPIEDGSLDAALTALNFHDIYNDGQSRSADGQSKGADGGETAAQGFLRAMLRKLKPGGVLGIIDHDGVPGQDNAKLHRIEKQRVLDVIAKSGFVLDAQSDLLSNEADDHTQSVFAPGLRGHTDRFLLRLRAPYERLNE
jgi:predicted methyltransferase